MERLLNNLMHIVELLREVLKPGGLQEWKRVDPRRAQRILKLPVPQDSSCYPHHADLDSDQVVYEDEL